MKVHLIKVQTISDFVLNNARSKVSFDHWLVAVKSADWEDPKDIISSFAKSDNLGNGADRIVFNIGGTITG